MRLLLTLPLVLLTFAACDAADPDVDAGDTTWLTDDGSADNASSTQVDMGPVHLGPSPGVRVEGTFALKEKHLYRFVGVAKGAVRLELRAVNSRVNAAIAIVTPKGTTVARTAWQDASGADAVADYVLPADGEYRIVAATYRLKTAGAYALTLTCMSGPCEPAEPTLWSPTLRPVTAAKALALVEAASAITYTSLDPTPRELGVAWAWIQENCNRRAAFVNFSLAQGASQVLLPSPIPAAMLTKTVSAPAFDSAQIYLAGPLNVAEQFVLPDGTTDASWSTLAAWDHHIAVVVNVDGTLMVVDPSLRKAPVPIAEWIASYVPAGVECPHLDDESFLDTKTYYAMRWQFTPSAPAHACGYVFRQPFGLTPDDTLTTDAVKTDLEGGRQLLGANFEALQGSVNQLTGRNLGGDEVPGITARLSPLTDAEMCRRMDYAFKWCQAYR
ncbi:MAG: hypothetical protein HY906_12095 [Deltaproteobacteria bacterium]|nr:hypothetical protein [Deltaproteobacteria bacterium]